MRHGGEARLSAAQHRSVSWTIVMWGGGGGSCTALPSCGGQGLPEVSCSDNVTLTEEEHRELL